jgi:hypothetical protein
MLAKRRCQRLGDLRLPRRLPAPRNDRGKMRVSSSGPGRSGRPGMTTCSAAGEFTCSTYDTLLRLDSSSLRTSPRTACARAVLRAAAGVPQYSDRRLRDATLASSTYNRSTYTLQRLRHTLGVLQDAGSMWCLKAYLDRKDGTWFPVFRSTTIDKGDIRGKVAKRPRTMRCDFSDRRIRSKEGTGVP